MEAAQRRTAVNFNLCAKRRRSFGGHSLFALTHGRVLASVRARREGFIVVRRGKNFRMLMCLGLGYSATALARRWQVRGGRVAATIRRAAAAADDGILRADFFDAGAVAALIRDATHLVISIPPSEGGEPTLDAFAAAIAAAPHLRWVAYLSSTGVYGDRGGGWVDETSDCRPSKTHGRYRAEAEREWLSLWRDRGVPVHVFRLSGIYGPGRSALDQLSAGTAKRIDKPGQMFSRIHVDDIALVLEASMARPRPGAIYNVADDLPAPAHEVVAHAAALLGLDPPPLEPFDPARMTPMAASFYSENRRVSNARLKRELGIDLRYPDYRAGLGGILAAQATAP